MASREDPLYEAAYEGLYLRSLRQMAAVEEDKRAASAAPTAAVEEDSSWRRYSPPHETPAAGAAPTAAADRAPIAETMVGRGAVTCVHELLGELHGVSVRVLRGLGSGLGDV